MSSPPPFEIAGHMVAPGQCQNISLPVSDLASGIPAHLQLRVIHGTQAGPAIFVSAAVHGDEIIGTAIIQQLLPLIKAEELAGTLLIIPAVNIYGFTMHSRYLPDRRDLNRSFPGASKGSLAAQLAHIFLNEVICHCSLGIDIHSAALHRYNLPQIRITPGNRKLRELAMAFGAPAIIESPLREKSLREVARQKGVGMLLMEAGEALRFDDLSVRAGVSGILNVMVHLQMLPAAYASVPGVPPARSRGSSWLRAPRGGVCFMDKISGAVVNQGDLLARVTDIFGENGEDILSPIDGIIIGHSNLPIVNQGDALIHIARVRDFDTVEERVEEITEGLLNEDYLGDDLLGVTLDEDEVL